MEKKKIKLSLAAAVCITIIVILIIALGCMYYVTKHKNNEQEAATIEENVINVNNIPEETTKKSEILTSSEIQKILGPEDAIFCIEDIEKSGDEYIITAYMLEKENRVVTKSEYEKLLNGGEIEFRKLKWKKDDNTKVQEELREGIYIKSGNNLLLLDYDKQKEEGTIENAAGAATGGLRDYSSKKIKFKVSKNIEINGSIGNETTNSFNELLKMSEECSGSYEECKAFVKDGKVNSIQIFGDNLEIIKDEENNEEDIQTEKNAQKDNSKNIIMYMGRTNIYNAKTGIHWFDYESKEYESFYNTTYDIYQKGRKTGQTKGTIKSSFAAMWDETEYYIEFEQVDRENSKDSIFVSCDYNIVPREYENVNDIPSIIKVDFPDSDSLKMQSVDLDGDGIKEYIVAYRKDQNNLAGVYLYGSNYNRISMIAEQTGYTEYLSNFDNITYMDIDNDNNMEIIIKIPVAASVFRFGIYKYEDGSVKGQIDTFNMSA